MQDRLLTVEEVAAYLRVGTITVYRWCRSGKLSGIKIGKEWRVARKDLEAFVAERKVEVPPSSVSDIFRRRLRAPEHILVMLTDPEKVYELEAQFFQVGLSRGRRLFKGCWWQHPDDVRQRLQAAGLPVEELESQGQLAIHDFWEAYRRSGPSAVFDLWLQTAREMEGEEVFWGSGAHLLDEWKGKWEAFLRYEAELNEILLQLPAVVLCPCTVTPAAPTGTAQLLHLVPHHSGALFLPREGPVLMRMVS